MSCLDYTSFGKLVLRNCDDDIRLRCARDISRADGWSGFVDDVFVSMLDGDQTASEDQNSFSRKLFDVASSDPNWLNLQDAARVHSSLSIRAASGIAVAMSKVMGEEISEEEQRHDDEENSAEGTDVDDGEADQVPSDGDEGRGPCPSLPDPMNVDQGGPRDASDIGNDQGDKVDVQKSIALLSATNDLAEELEEDAKRVEMLRGIGLVADVTNGVDPIDDELIDAVTGMEDFDDFLDMLGKGEEAHGSGASESVCNVVGVEVDGDISRLIPLELVKLRHPVLTLETKKRILEREAFCYEYEEEETSKGDFVLMVDRSWSMEGSRIRWARSLAISIIRRCVDEDRRVVLSIFSGTGDVEVVIVEDKKTMAEAIKSLLQSVRGGTDFDDALLKTGEHVVLEDDDVDVLVITDCQLPPFTRKPWMNGRLVCAAIGCGSVDGFDAMIQINEVNGDAMVRVVEELI